MTDDWTRAPARGRRTPWSGIALIAVGVVLAVVAVVLLVSRSGAPAARPTTPAASLTPWSTQGPDADPIAYAQRLVALTNARRADAGLAALATSDCAAAQAGTRAEALAGGKALVHAPMDPVLRACDVSQAGENLARAAATPDDVVKAWMASPGHRENLLEPGYTAVGITCRLDVGQMLCSQVFLGGA